MKTRCPACGATASLELLIAHDDAREAMIAVSKLGGELAKQVLRYLGLFRPAQKELTFARMAKLLNELLPDIQSGRIERNGQVFEAPLEAWFWGFEQIQQAKLVLPLKSHGYLYEILSTYQGQGAKVSVLAPEQPVLANTPVSKTKQGLARLAGMKRGKP